jgi:hypothetical protein
MSAFSDRFVSCMTGKGLPVPAVESINEVKELAEQLHSAWESAGGETQMTIGALLVVGAATGIDEAALAVLEEAAGILVTVYIGACLVCLAASGIDELRNLFASSPPQPFMRDGLAELGIAVDERGTAVA